MAVRTPTQWQAPSGTGYVTPSTLADLSTQSGVTLSTQAGVNININPNVYKPKYYDAWIKSGRNTTSWTPPSGTGYVVQQANLLFTDNSGIFIVTNTGNNLVTNTTYNKAKADTLWTATGL